MVSAPVSDAPPVDDAPEAFGENDRWCGRCLLLGPGIHITLEPNEQFPHMLGTHEWGRLLTLTLEEATKLYTLTEGKTHAENASQTR